MSLTFAVPDSVLSTTLANYRNTLEDNIFKANPLYFWLIGQYPEVAGQTVQSRGKKKIHDGGESIVVPLMYETNSTVKSYSGYGILDTTPQNGITSARYEWKQLSGSISISGLEARKNSGKSQIIDLLKAKIMQTEMSLQEEFDREAFGTAGDTSTDISGLQNIVSTTTTAGGISGTTYSWWQSKVTTSAGSFAATGLAKMRTKYNDVSKGSDHADLILTDQTSFEYYESVLQPQERFTDTKVGDAGFENLKFKGAVMMFDANCTAGYMYFLNSNYLNWEVHRDADFTTTDFIRPDNQDAKVAQILVQGELTCSNRARQGLITGITA